jgi:hypothetical protein
MVDIFFILYTVVWIPVGFSMVTAIWIPNWNISGTQMVLVFIILVVWP